MTDQVDANAPGAGDTVTDVELISSERLVFFSDAVVAIAITLLALALRLPPSGPRLSEGAVASGLWAVRDDYLPFLISFIVIGAHWRGHHRLFRAVGRLDSRVISLNMAWLLMIVITPYATRLLSGDGGFGVRFGIYAAVQVVTLATLVAMNRHVRGSGLVRPGVPQPGSVAGDVALLAVAAMFAISIPLGFIPAVGQWAYLVWVASALVGRRLARTHRDHGAAHVLAS